jgi:hypothetical protein
MDRIYARRCVARLKCLNKDLEKQRIDKSPLAQRKVLRIERDIQRAKLRLAVSKSNPAWNQ